jgi:hypothetical protein
MKAPRSKLWGAFEMKIRWGWEPHISLWEGW